MSGTCQSLREDWNGSCHNVKCDARKASVPNEDCTCNTLTSYIPRNENMSFIYKNNIFTNTVAIVLLCIRCVQMFSL